MWKFKITNINIDITKGNDSFEFTVKFIHTDGRKVPKIYKIYLTDLTEISIEEIKKMIVVDKNNLIKLDEIKAVLENNFEKEYEI